MSLNSDFQKLYVDGLIRLYELDATSLGAGILRFHGHIDFYEWESIYLTVDSTLITVDSTKISADQMYVAEGKKIWKRNIIFNGQTYEPMALEVSGLEMRSDGKASAPTLSMANNINGIQNAVSAYCLQFKDFAGAKLKVITTLAKYLDAENFSGGNASASPSEKREQLWFIEQKTSENANQVSFELSNPVDFEGLKIPTRQISNYCGWEYRSEECGYIGSAMFTEKDEPTDNPALDSCNFRTSGCNCRDNATRFGGFPASNMV